MEGASPALDDRRAAARSADAFTAGNGSGTLRFRAFISYSHADESAASKLHHWLETYSLPRNIVGKPTLKGVVPRRLNPIFRDRNEFAAASDLSEEVAAALSASRALLVLCSPAAKASRWVDSEIRLFRALHPKGDIILALLQGEPADAFPRAVLEVEGGQASREPIAADFRKHGDGKQLARLKIVAGLVGLPLDEVIQRENQRQLRRVMGITLAAILAALMLSFMLAFALTARNQAERQRQQAEGLIEFMLTDLRSRLQGVGRLDILGAVNDRALAYYAAEKDLHKLPDPSLERRARVLHAMGEDDQRRGRADMARLEFEEARRATAALLRKSPNNADRIFAHAQSEFWLGYVSYTHKDARHALPRFEAYLMLARRLMAVAPDAPRSMRELAYAYGNICSLQLDQSKDAVASQVACQQSLNAMQKVAQALPQDRSVWSDLANREAWVSQALEDGGKKEQALAARRHQIGIVDKLLASDPHNATFREDWVLAQFSTAKLLKKLGQNAAAASAARQATTGLDALLQIDPANVDWRYWRRDMTATFPELSQKD